MLAERYSLPLLNATHLEEAKARELERFVRSQILSELTQPNYVFLFSATGLSLMQIQSDRLLNICADFYGPTVNYRRHKGGGKGQMIAKAVGLHTGQLPTVLDATAGLGGDAFVLASLGCSITMTERVVEVRALLADGLRVAREWGGRHEASLITILDRMHLLDSDAASYMQTLAPTCCPDVIYLDPMFPVRTKRTQVKKEMHVFHQLVGSDPDADQLLEIACAKAKKRVVVKRPRIAPQLADAKPSYTLEGKSNRFDVYVCG
ncbi:class I SAM-dependent methyltransferase [Thalassobacterium sedimentorum]